VRHRLGALIITMNAARWFGFWLLLLRGVFGTANPPVPSRGHISDTQVRHRVAAFRSGGVTTRGAM